MINNMYVKCEHTYIALGLANYTTFPLSHLDAKVVYLNGKRGFILDTLLKRSIDLFQQASLITK